MKDEILAMNGYHTRSETKNLEFLLLSEDYSSEVPFYMKTLYQKKVPIYKNPDFVWIIYMFIYACMKIFHHTE